MGRIFKGILIGVLLMVGYFPVSLLWRETKVVHTLTPYGGQFVDTTEGAIYVQHLGYPEQPTVVFLHGAGAWSETWKSTSSFMARKGYRAVSLDVPPFGLSPMPKHKKLSARSQVQRLRDAIDGYGIRDLILVGHSWSAPYTIELGRQLGSRLKGMVLVTPYLGLTKNSQLESPYPQWFLKIMSYKAARRMAASVLTHPWAIKYLLGRAMIQKRVVTPHLMTVYQVPFGYKGANTRVSEWIAQMLFDPPRMFATDLDFARTVPAPILLISADRDPIVTRDQTQRIRNENKLLMSKEIPYAGHFPHLEQADVFNDTLFRFAQPLMKPRPNQ